MIGGRGGYHLEREPIKKDDSDSHKPGCFKLVSCPREEVRYKEAAVENQV